MRLAWGGIYQHSYREKHAPLDFEHIFFTHLRKHKRKNQLQTTCISSTWNDEVNLNHLSVYDKPWHQGLCLLSVKQYMTVLENTVAKGAIGCNIRSSHRQKLIYICFPSTRSDYSPNWTAQQMLRGHFKSQKMGFGRTSECPPGHALLPLTTDKVFKLGFQNFDSLACDSLSIYLSMIKSWELRLCKCRHTHMCVCNRTFLNGWVGKEGIRTKVTHRLPAKL